MPDKPDRPILSVTFGWPSLLVQKFSPDKNLLETQWAQRFCDEYDKQFGLRYRVEGRAPEPGDVLLRSDGGADVHLQITEAIDVRRLHTERLRRAYSEAVWKLTPELKTVFKGIKIAITDAGQAPKLPQDPGSSEVMALARELGKFLLSLEPVLKSIPVFPPGGFPRQHLTFTTPGGIEIAVLLSRYAAPGVSAPAQWVWFGPIRLIGGDEEISPHYFLTTIQNKVGKSYAKPAEPLWLLVYSVDCFYNLHQQAAVKTYLRDTKHPFAKVFVLAHPSLQQVYPVVGEITVPEGSEGHSVLGSDCIPKIEDPRYVNIP